MHTEERTTSITQTEKISISLFDKDGFICDPDLWDKDVAHHIAHIESLGKLTTPHWQVINFVRNYYLEKGAPPLMRQVCRQLKLSKYHAVGLFSGCLQVWKIAGLPNPGDEARGHLH